LSNGVTLFTGIKTATIKKKTLIDIVSATNGFEIFKRTHAKQKSNSKSQETCKFNNPIEAKNTATTQVKK
jgi:hypothetical protein